MLVNREIHRAGMDDLLAAGIVITGGTGLLPGIEQLGEQVMEMPVRVGKPVGISGLADMVNSPIYATGIGLVLWGRKNFLRKPFVVRGNNFLLRSWEWLRSTVAEYL